MFAHLESSLLVVFALDERRFALPFAVVERVIRAVEVTPLLNAPAIVLGVINVQGRIISVVNLRKACGLPERETDPDDHFILAHMSQRIVALPVETADVIECDPDTEIHAEGILSVVDGLRGVVKDRGGLILIYDLDALLSLEQTPSGVMAPAGGIP